MHSFVLSNWHKDEEALKKKAQEEGYLDPVITLLFFCSQVLSSLDILQPPHIDFFQEVYPFYFLIIPLSNLQLEYMQEKVP